MSNRTIAICAGLLMVLAAGLTWLLLARFGDGSPASNAQLDGIRTVGTIVLGAGGAIALLLAARRQQTAEHDLVHRRQVAAETQAHQLRVALNAEADATERRITELFDTAVDKLGSDKAAVRFGGLYALERLAGHAPAQQRPITKVLCAYLRMPYLAPGEDPGPDTDETIRARYEHRREEREVRLAVQRVLADHLRLSDASDHSATAYWADAEIDLAGATLINLDWRHCRIPGTARFNRAVFAGAARFRGAIFTGAAAFHEATFTKEARFRGAVFAEGAWFSAATFTGSALFHTATFTGPATFHRATFFQGSMFSETAEVDFTDARVRLPATNQEKSLQRWPTGWSVRSVAAGPATEHAGAWGTVVQDNAE